VRLLLATHNEHKRREFARLLDRPGEARRWDVASLPASVELPPEEGETFAANALAKARAAAAATGEVSIADDSGIAAAALGGAPGVRSARYAGEHATDEENLQRLRSEAPVGSALEYVCAIAYVDPIQGTERVFGYDPVFVPDDSPPALAGLTMAELSDEQKDAISHRARAVRALAAWLTAG
jgi:XTP/dITP diphosphohydrolase